MQKTTVKIIKLINGDDIVTVLPTGDKQLPDNGPLIRQTNHYKLNMYLKLRLWGLEIILL